jgi:hypothetical protein
MRLGDALDVRSRRRGAMSIVALREAGAGERLAANQSPLQLHL